MVNVIVEHRWKNRDNNEVVKVMGGIMEMAKDRKLPEGFELKSINVLNTEYMAICNWEAPSLNGLKELLEKVNPPTKHKLIEAQKLY
jgi:hypothetical protein